MPVLKERETKTIKLKTIEGGEVEVYTSLTAADAEAMSKLQAEHPITAPLQIILKSWNLTNAEDKVLKITPGNIWMLNVIDVHYIADECGINDRTFLASEPIENGSE